MNKVVLDILTEPDLRSPEALETALSQQFSAGLPWLTG